MNLKAKIYEQNHKKATAENLAARLTLLESNGFSRATIAKDSLVKKLKADIRKADRRLAQVAVQEKLKAKKLSIKIEKAAAKKKAQEPAQAQKGKQATAKPQKKEKKPKEKKQVPAEQE